MRNRQLMFSDRKTNRRRQWRHINSRDAFWIRFWICAPTVLFLLNVAVSIIGDCLK